MKTQNNATTVGDFYRGARLPYEVRLDDKTIDLVLDRASYVLEEARELYAEVVELRWMLRTNDVDKDEYQECVHNLLKELGDVLYTAYGVAGTLNINPQVLFNRISDSNLSKLTGGAIINSEGKVTKGPNYKAPDLSDLVEVILK